MKTTDVFFEGTNFVGRQIENVQDLVKALAANMDIANADGCGYSCFGEREVTDEDGDTHYEEYEKTDEELFNEMKEDLDNGNVLYAGFYLDCRKYNIMASAATTLQSDLHIGQKCYVMHGNKIQCVIIRGIALGTFIDERDNRIFNKAKYHVDRNALGTFLRSELFTSKEELVKHLMED